jgi:hypothetical protein
MKKPVEYTAVRTSRYVKLPYASDDVVFWDLVIRGGFCFWFTIGFPLWMLLR